MSEKNPYQNEIDQIDLALFDIEINEGKPHSHFEYVNPEYAEIYKKASENIATVSVDFVDLNSEDAARIVADQKPSIAQALERMTADGYVGVVVSTLPDANGQHPQDGTAEFYAKVRELKPKPIERTQAPFAEEYDREDPDAFEE